MYIENVVCGFVGIVINIVVGERGRIISFRGVGCCQREFIEVNIDVFQIGIRIRNILVVEVDYMNVMMLVEVFICLDGGVWQLFDQVFILYVCFMEGWIGSFLVILLCDGIGYVSVEIEVFIVFFYIF